MPQISLSCNRGLRRNSFPRLTVLFNAARFTGLPLSALVSIFCGMSNCEEYSITETKQKAYAMQSSRAIITQLANLLIFKILQVTIAESRFCSAMPLSQTDNHLNFNILLPRQKNDENGISTVLGNAGKNLRSLRRRKLVVN